VLNGIGLPPFFEIGRCEVVEHGTTGSGEKVAKELVSDPAPLPVERMCLSRVGMTAGNLALANDSLYAVYLLVLEGDIDRSEGDGLAGGRAEALTPEDGVCVIAERLVL
jgi:hypothetical protein